MRKLKDETVYDGKYISVVARHFEDKKGRRGIWEMIRRKTHGDIVSIFALTKDREVILEKIFRVPLNGYAIELPAGLMDKPGENPDDAILRELTEETGYTVPRESLQLMLRGTFNAGLLEDQVRMYFADNAEKTEEADTESTEDITVFTMPLDKLPEFAAHPPEGCIMDLKILALLPLLQVRKLI